MPLEDEIIPDDKHGANRGDGLQNFLDSAQSALTEAVAKSAAEKAVDNMFSSGQHANRGGGPPQEGLYPDINRENNRNQDPSIMDTAQNAFADAFAKRAAERLVDGILPSNNTRPEGNYGPPAENARSQGPEHSGFDLGKLGSSLLESLSDQVLHPDKQNSQQQHYPQQQQTQGQGKEQPGFDLGSVGSELLSSLAEQVLHPNKAQPEQLQTSARPPRVESENQSGFDFSKVGSELLGSLAEQVLHPTDKKVTEQQQLPPNQDSNKPDFDIGKVIGSLAEQVLHPSDKKEDVQQQSRNHESLENQPRPHSLADTAGDIASSVLGSLADSVLHKNTNNESKQYQGPNYYGPPQGPGSQWYPPPGYRQGPEGYGPGPYAYGPGPQGYWSGPQGYGPPSQNYGPGSQGYWPPPEGYGPNPHRMEPPQPNPKNEQSAEDVGSMLLNTVATAVRQNPAPSQSNMPMPPLPASALSYGPENGLYPKLDTLYPSGPGIHPPQPGLHPEGIIPHMPSNTMPLPHMHEGLPQPPSISSTTPSPYPDSAHAPFPIHSGSDHHDVEPNTSTDFHSHLSRRDLKKIAKAEHKMEKEIYKAQKKAEKRAYKAQKRALKKKGVCSHCNHYSSCSCSSSSSD